MFWYFIEILFIFSRYLTDKLLQVCEKFSDASITSQRKILDKALFIVPFEKDGELIQFQKTAESFLVAKQPLKPIENIANAEESLPDIYPLKSNISIDKENIYQIKNIYRKFESQENHQNVQVYKMFFF